MSLTSSEAAYLSRQQLGRLATIGPNGEPQIRPVVYVVDAARGTIDIGGFHMVDTQKYRNLQRDSRLAFVVDDLGPGEGFAARGVEIRGHAEILEGEPPLMPGFDGAVIRVHTDRVLSWGLE